MYVVRMQGGAPYKGLTDAFVTIAKKEGILSFWNGCIPAIQRSMIVNAAEMATYDQAKKFILSTRILEDGVMTHGLASFLAGFIAAVTSTPLDVAKTR